MSWVTVIWSMVAAACLTLAAMHLMIWCTMRNAWANLLFSILTAATAAMAFCELSMMRAETPGQFATALRWLHAAAFVLILSMIGFVRVYMGSGRRWLAWTVCALRALSLLLNFFVGQNLNYLEVTRLRPVRFLGESVTTAEGISNPFMLVGQLSLLLFVVFVADAALSIWQCDKRRQALVLGGSIVFFVLAGTVQSVLVLWQVVHWPYAPSFFFLGVVAVMAYEMSRDTLRAGQLSHDLKESEERLTMAAEAAGFGVWMWNVARDEVWAAPRWFQLFGLAPDEKVKLEKLVQQIHPEDRDRVEHAIRRAVERGVDYAEEYRVRLPDGSERWISARGRMFPNGNGRPARLMGASLDITERRLTEEKLRQSSYAMEQSPVLVVVTDKQGRIVYVNKKFTEVTGYSRDECLGQNPRILKSGESSPAVYQELWHTITAGKTWHGEFHNRKKNGELYWESAVIAPLLDDAARITHFVALKEDVTERRKNEAELAQQRDQLTHLSRVNMLGELTGSLAHELNQPLTAVLSNAQAAQRFLARNPVDLDEVREILADIVAEDKRAGEVIQRLRLLLKKGEVQQQALNVNEVVQEVLKLVRSDLVNHNFTAQTELAPNLPILEGDRVQLQQVLLNLVMNGCDAMAGASRNHRKLTIRTRQADAGWVEISVADRGTGIEPERLGQVFEPFHTTKPHGLGLGLAVCRTIVTAHGGKLWATNNSARGATIHFTLPVTPKEKA